MEGSESALEQVGLKLDWEGTAPPRRVSIPHRGMEEIRGEMLGWSPAGVL